MTTLLVGALAGCALLPWWTGATGRRHRLMALADRRALDGGGPDGRGRGGGHRQEVEVVVLLELMAAAVRAGAGIPRALDAVGAAAGGEQGRALTAVATALRLGSSWDAAWTSAPRGLDPVARGLRGAWRDGAAPGEALRAAGAEVRHARRSAARNAAGRLAVRLVLPLGLCYLPAFVLVGLAPVLLALGLDVLAT